MGEDLSGVPVLGEIVKTARRNLDQNIWDYLTGGAESETTLLRNRQAIDSIAFRPRVLCNVHEVSTQGTVLGATQRIPVLLAPVGSLQHFDPRGSLAAASAAHDFGVSAFISSVTTPSMEEVRAETEAHLVFQLYVRGDDEWIFERLDTARDLGYAALCLTVDTANYGRRERDLTKRFLPSARIHNVEGRMFQAALDWETVARIRDRYTLPLMVKGIATGEDAEKSLSIGLDAVYVSNHGGRQLDHGRGAIEMLPEVVEAVGGKREIIIDGGFCRGTDVIKAIAMGADAVGVGKLYSLGLAAGGEAGVRRVLELLEAEMLNAMALLGVTSLDQLGPEHVVPAAPVRWPSMSSAFPLFEDLEYRY